MKRDLGAVLDDSIPEISVVLPVWNGERFLTAAIASILAQSFRALELIVIDDGSTDRSAAIAQEFADGDARVIVLHRDHDGFAKALNAGIGAARGQYIARMDDDDISLPARLEKQIAYLELHADCVAVGSWVEVIDETGAHLGYRTFLDTHEEITEALIGGFSPLAHPTVVVRRKALIAAGGYALNRYPSEDYDLWIKLSEVGKLANLREPLLQYRRHRGAVGVRDREQQLAMGVEILNDARKKRSLHSVRRRWLAPVRSRAARYHFECARVALMGGPRMTAVRHAVSSIGAEPLWLDPYAVLLACALPKVVLKYTAALYARLRLAASHRHA